MGLAVWGMMHEIRDPRKADAVIPHGLLDSQIGEAEADWRDAVGELAHRRPRRWVQTAAARPLGIPQRAGRALRVACGVRGASRLRAASGGRRLPPCDGRRAAGGALAIAEAWMRGRWVGAWGRSGGRWGPGVFKRRLLGGMSVTGES